MAFRDRSQGFGFVYVDIDSILANAQAVAENEKSKTLNFNKDPKQNPQPEVVKERITTIREIRDNLDRLQSLHHKLHAILQDLNSMSERKKR